MGSHYRPDIDGLRAIAVLSVVLAHAGAPFLEGGFLGVDVFFVISGYLITSILLREMDEGRFSLARFYERRARRILPALILVILACVPFALWLMLPDVLQNFGQSVVATLLFANNLLLAVTSGYWQLESSFKPLLHTWSLGVEEQFYILFPLMLALLWRFGRRAQLAAIVLLGLVSFGLAEHGWRTYPEANFYLPTSRAWELMVGCAAAYVVRKPGPFDNVASLLGLAAILLPMTLFDELTPSPSAFSAIPVAGTAAVILFSRPGTVAFKALSWTPLVGIGLVSYSAYLWHQPLFAFSRIASPTPPSAVEITALTGLTFVLAYLTWRYVEVPFRAGVSLRRLVPMLAAPSAALIAGGLVAHVQQGFPRWTFPNIERSSDVYIAYNERVREFAAPAFPANGRPNVLLIGDSYARDIGNVLIEGQYLAGRNLVYLVDDLSCDLPNSDLVQQADTVLIALNEQSPACAQSIAAGLPAGKRAIFFGAKHFGYNLNPAARVPLEARRAYFVHAPSEKVASNEALRGAMPAGTYVDILRALGPDGRRLHYFDNHGNPLSPDRLHLTRYGAQYVAERLRDEPALAGFGSPRFAAAGNHEPASLAGGAN